MTPQTVPDPDLVRMYDEAAMQYSLRLSGENLMEAFAQGQQRKITLESFDLVARVRSDVHCFNELMIQYPLEGRTRPRKVVPDNLVVLHDGPLDVGGHFGLTEQPARPFLVIEYVSKYNQRKDYEENYEKYETELRVPYYLHFFPDDEELVLYRLNGDRYEAVQPNASRRLSIPELELEVALHDGWVRYWFRGELLPLPADLADQRDEERAGRQEAERERAAERDARQEAERERAAERDARQEAERERDRANTRAALLEAELARLRDELARAKGV